MWHYNINSKCERRVGRAKSLSLESSILFDTDRTSICSRQQDRKEGLEATVTEKRKGQRFLCLLSMSLSTRSTLAQNLLFIQKINWILRIEKWDFENVNFDKNVILKLWILSKMRPWKCGFCQKCELCEKWDCENVNFV